MRATCPRRTRSTKEILCRCRCWRHSKFSFTENCAPPISREPNLPGGSGGLAGQIDDLFRLDHTSPVDQIEAAFRALNRDIIIRWKPPPETRKGRLPGPFRPAKRPRSAHHNHPRSDAHAVVKVDHVLVGHADAAGGNRLPDRLRLVRAVATIERRAEIQGARAKRIVDAAAHVPRQVGAAAQHFPRRRPARPGAFLRDDLGARPFEAAAADADAVADRRAVTEHVIEAALAGRDDDRAGLLIGVETNRPVPPLPQRTSKQAAEKVEFGVGGIGREHQAEDRTRESSELSSHHFPQGSKLLIRGSAALVLILLKAWPLARTTAPFRPQTFV